MKAATAPALDLPLGLEVRRDAAVRHLETMKAETLRAVAVKAVAGGLPSHGATFDLWALGQDERLAVLDAAIAHFRSLPGTAVVARAES